MVPPAAPAVAVFLFLVNDLFRGTFALTFLRTIVYGGLVALAIMRYKEAENKLQIEADGFMIKSGAKKTELKSGVHKSLYQTSPDGDVSVTAGGTGAEFPTSSWPPIDTLGWTPFKSMPFGQAKGKGADHFWAKGSHSQFHIRSVGYKQSKAKEPSEAPLYECIGVDIVKSSKLITDISHTPVFKRILAEREPSDIPYPWLKWKDSKWTPSLGVPRMIVINAQLPYSSPSLWAPQSPDSDPGFSIVSYYAISPAVAEALTKGRREFAAIKLLKRLISEGQSTKDDTALKAIGLVENMEEVGFPDMVAGYNGKPVLVTKSLKFEMVNDGELMEIEFDIRKWSIIARKSLNSLKDKFRDTRCQIGMVIEGRTDDELPEQLLGCYRLLFLDVQEALNIEI